MSDRSKTVLPINEQKIRHKGGGRMNNTTREKNKILIKLMGGEQNGVS